jgi:DNA-binding MarR family transcriptional regulator
MKQEKRKELRKSAQRVLFFIYRSRIPCRRKNLVLDKNLKLSEKTISSVLQELQMRGLIESRAFKEDKRGTVYYLTGLGEIVARSLFGG